MLPNAQNSFKYVNMKFCPIGNCKTYDANLNKARPRGRDYLAPEESPRRNLHVQSYFQGFAETDGLSESIIRCDLVSV
jgi:hypothetical protein